MNYKKEASDFIYDHEEYKYQEIAAKEAKLLKVDRNTLNPLEGLSFVSIAYYKLTSGKIIGIVF